MLDKNDYINDKFHCYCDKCGRDRGYQLASRANKLCKSCQGCISHSAISDETRKKMSRARLGKAPSNKGTKSSKETKAKMSRARLGKVPVNKGKTMPMEQRVKLSCTNRGIEIEEFDKFSMADNHKERLKLVEVGLPKLCFERDGYTCRICLVKGSTLNAHHLQGWNKFPEQRFSLDNLATLCESCHRGFHEEYGYGDKVTKDNLVIYLKSKLQPVYLLCGVTGAGKSWVASNLLEKSDGIYYVSYDSVAKKEHFNILTTAVRGDLPVVYDLPFKVSTTVRRWSNNFNLIPVFILEDEVTIAKRLEERGGKFTEAVGRRVFEMRKRATKYGKFSGTSKEVLSWLINQTKQLQ